VQPLLVLLALVALAAAAAALGSAFVEGARLWPGLPAWAGWAVFVALLPLGRWTGLPVAVLAFWGAWAGWGWAWWQAALLCVPFLALLLLLAATGGLVALLDRARRP
jgi:hypothetical protein